ncbi:hypothetical protein ERO13_D08G090200v2 [Gossypium hirsutum]|uniref:Protein LURP-one-related 15 isoform X1 n=2 Tax=Gossypium TaxID=3633 RepID=A0A1U8KMK7_GOSHI|nr:protein LURP-one-related 15-like isoform X1 [Gossypium hirsutum]KAG4133331.1 hypothetical protein ERO13_D08G090200v2 [Gossypium hirsutum]
MENVQEYPPPAAASAYPPLATRVSVIEPEYCYPQPVDLAVVRKVLTISEGKFAVSDINANIMIKIKGKIFSIHDRRLLTDAAGNPICTLRHKGGKHGRKRSDVHSEAIISSMIQLKTKLHVFLATSPKENVCDFKVEGSWLERSCIIYSGESNTILAQMHKKHNVESVLLGKDKFMVMVYPNVVYAFVVALIAILDGINHDDDE